MLKNKHNMYYITKRNTATGKKFQKVSDKMDKAFEEVKALADELKVKEWRNATWVAYGGMSCVLFKKGVNPDQKLWKKAYGGYVPKLNCNAGKDIAKKMEDLTTVSVRELNACVGYKEPLFQRIGFGRKSKSYFGFVVGEKWGVKIPKDCKEVTLTQYNKLFDK